MAYSLSGERPLAAAARPFALLATLVTFVRQAGKARRRRVALTTLLEMDEYRLWDLGISPGDLRAALRSEDFDIEAVRDARRSLDVWPPR